MPAVEHDCLCRPNTTRRQNGVYLGPLGIDLPNRRLQVDTPHRSPVELRPRVWGEYNRITLHDTRPEHLRFH